jgi:hypothetical protein
MMFVYQILEEWHVAEDTWRPLEPVPDPAPVRLIRRAVDHALLQLGSP